jgi:hypothetical protein
VELMNARSIPLGGPAGPTGPSANRADTAAYILDMTKTMAAMATGQNLEMLAYLLNMAALEAAEAQIRAKPVRTVGPAPPTGRGGEE